MYNTNRIALVDSMKFGTSLKVQNAKTIMEIHEILIIEINKSYLHALKLFSFQLQTRKLALQLLQVVGLPINKAISNRMVELKKIIGIN